MEKKPILAFDLGDSWVGIAISNTNQTLSFPLTTMTLVELKNKINQLLAEHGTTTIVYGQPMGNPAWKAQADRIQTIVSNLQAIAPNNIIWLAVDEKCTSLGAQHILQTSGRSLQKHKLKEHSLAAALLLEKFLKTIISA